MPIISRHGVMPSGAANLLDAARRIVLAIYPDERENSDDRYSPLYSIFYVQKSVLKRPTIKPAQLRARESSAETPFSEPFADKYFSEQDGLAESRAVFVDASGFPARWRDQRQCVVGELGFGSGLNFLATWQAWAADPARCDQLYYLSVEQSPLTVEVIAGLAARWPALREYADALAAAYPEPSPGHHWLRFADGRVNLLLAFGAAEQLLPEWQMGVDAWYLDGFAPSRNPAMWSKSLLKLVARNTRVGGTISTFTAAGQVRRDLLAVGFAVEKRPGFGGKRERLVGTFAPPSPKQASRVTPMDASTDASRVREITIVGAGIAGLLLAWELRQQAPEAIVTVIAPDSGNPDFPVASQNPAAMVLPQLTREWTVRGYLHWQAFVYAQCFYPTLHNTLREHGVVDGDTKHEINWLWQGEAIRQLPRDFAAQQAGILADSLGAYQIPDSAVWLADDGLHFRNAMAIDGAGFRRAVIDALRSAALPGNPIRWCHGQINGWNEAAGQPNIAVTEDNAGWDAAAQQAIIYAVGAGSASAFPDSLSRMMHTTFGQLNRGQATPSSQQQATLLSADGYFTPCFSGDDQHYIGSSFDRGRPFAQGEADPAVTQSLRESLLPLLSRFGNAAAAAYREVMCDSPSFAAWRLHTNDRFPLLGPLPDVAALSALSSGEQARLVSSKPHFSQAAEPYSRSAAYLLSGLGAHGFCLAPLLAKSLAAELLGTPQPLQKTALRRAHPLWQWLQQHDPNRATASD